ncbi:MAG: PTS sugar transporter subunit IIA [Deltaproteobacteria bacterium]|nr:PTS sugar transporter subunit IIA [Deltaproteobacteria bacterium]
MVGILVSTHLRLGEELLKVAVMIKGPLELAGFVSVERDKPVNDIGGELAEAIKKLDHGDGVLILTDIFGGTPANMAFSFMRDRKVEVVTGVNLPMLLALYDARATANLQELACLAQETGKNNIHVAGKFLENNPQQ